MNDDYDKKIDELARRYIMICIETENLWQTYQEDCVKSAEKEINNNKEETE